MWTKLRAVVAGEVPADSLQAYRQAGLSVFDLIEQVESQRVARRIEGTDPWSASLADQAEAVLRLERVPAANHWRCVPR